MSAGGRAQGGAGRAMAAVATLVAAAFVGYCALSYFVQVPRVFGDEIIYLDAGDSLADGHGLHVQGHAYGRGPAYPATIAPLLKLSQNRSHMYLWIKVLNALAFSLAAIPVYLLARRLLPRKKSFAVAALSLAIPSSIYIGLVMTESLAFLAASIAFYAVVLAIERPTAVQQLAALAAIGLAYLVRPQFLVLYPVYLLALVATRRLLARGSRVDARALWPTALSVVLVVGGSVALALPRGRSVLGAYGDLWRHYSPAAVARWFEYDLADLGLYLGLIPLALLPPAVVAVYRRARGGSREAGAFLGVFCLATLFALLMAAAFDSTPAGLGQLHDRYLFYVVPLWLVGGAVWLEDGARRPLRAAAVGIALVLAVIAAFPADAHIVDDAAKQLHAAGTPLWVRLSDWALAHGHDGHAAIFAAAVCAAAAAYLVPRRLAPLLGVPVAAVFAVNSALLWTHDIRDNNTNVFADRSSATRGWIDHAVPAGQQVTMLYVSASRCGANLPYAYAQSAFFNDRVRAMPSLGRSAGGGLPSQPLHVSRGGRLVRPGGTALRANWVVLPTGVRVRGRAVARGASAQLVLWHVPGRVTVAAHSSRQLESEACSSPAAPVARAPQPSREPSGSAAQS